MSTYHHGDLRTALLLAGGELIEEQGVAGLKLREAARRAGVSHNAPYRHFPHRDALLAALAAEGFRMLGEELDGRSGGDMGEAYVRFALAHPNRFRLMFGGQLELRKHAGLREAAGRTYEALLAVFRDRRVVANPERAAAAAWSLVPGLAQLELDGHFAAG
ncbi:MAG: TetR/AcrR family transcriptional regulator, partial [Betaproteobacteria bacterium]|nr:TetR/AcrR family transcriptional regulator [Betaproteobacteria bacterium]